MITKKTPFNYIALGHQICWAAPKWLVKWLWEKRKLLFVLGATPNFVLIWVPTFVLRENFVFVFGCIGIWALLWGCYYTILYSPPLLVKISSVDAHGYRLKAKPHKFCVFSCVCLYLFFLSIFPHSYYLFGDIFQRSIIFSPSMLYGVLSRSIFLQQFGSMASAI